MRKNSTFGCSRLTADRTVETLGGDAQRTRIRRGARCRACGGVRRGWSGSRPVPGRRPGWGLALERGRIVPALTERWPWRLRRVRRARRSSAAAGWRLPQRGRCGRFGTRWRAERRQCANRWQRGGWQRRWTRCGRRRGRRGWCGPRGWRRGWCRRRHGWQHDRRRLGSRWHWRHQWRDGRHQGRAVHMLYRCVLRRVPSTTGNVRMWTGSEVPAAVQSRRQCRCRVLDDPV
jgi:hypothetical protein